MLSIWLSLIGCRPGDDPTADTDPGKDTDDEGTSDAFYTPIYDRTEELPPTFEADLSAVTDTVEQRQSFGGNLPIIESIAGVLELGNGQTIRLIEGTEVPCPDDIPDCDTIDSEELGIGPNALLRDLASVPIRNQGERPTCVSFSVNAAFEAAYAMDGGTVDLSEQNTYFQGKAIEGDWEVGGLYPDVVMAGFAETPVPLVEEEYWPYNPAQEDCDDYLAEHPDATCSETEAQGGGADSQEADPAIVASPEYFLIEGHRLYASTGRVKQALYRGYPVVATINANADFVVATFKDGVISWTLKVDSCTSVCAHAVLIFGYQDDPDVDGGGYVLIQNSWDDIWGDGGFAYATYEWLENSLLDASAVAKVR